MKYIFQLGIICFIAFVAELLYILLPISIPSSIIGLLLLFLLLLCNLIKLEQIEDVAGFFLSIMPIFFIAPSVSLLTSFDVIKGNVISLIMIAFFSTIVTMIVTGLVSQWFVRLLKRRKEKQIIGRKSYEPK